MKDKILCAIVDDEHLARELMQDYVSKISSLELVGVFSSPLELMNCEKFNEIELLFLDIQMPDITGVDFLKNMRVNPIVIFTTAYSEYALEGYQLNVVEYLLKPIVFPRFVKAVDKAMTIVNTKRKANLNLELQNSSSERSENLTKDYIIVKADRKKYKINFSEILYIEGALEYVSFYLKEKKITAYYSMKELEAELPNSLFIRVHKSYIVNYNEITEIEGNIAIVNNKEIPIGRNYKKQVHDKFI